jgi:undecaprenyl diphosphate synthase
MTAFAGEPNTINTFSKSAGAGSKKESVGNDQDNNSLSPQHIAIIMDGNNRWAKKRFLPGITGHKAGVEAIRKVLSACERHDVKALTLFAFSSENWQRPKDEVGALMSLLLTYLKREVNELHEKGIRIRFIGRRDRLNADIVKQMGLAESLTENNTRSTLVLAVDYGGQWDIANAAKAIAERVSKGELALENIDHSVVDQYTACSDLPKPDLCIRTGGEYRVSNFLLWQLAYTELYFTDCYWPDFDEQEIDAAVAAFASRQRRYGMTSEQMAAAESSNSNELDANTDNDNNKTAWSSLSRQDIHGTGQS